MSDANKIDCDVMIVGMGPVGKMAAILLGRAGHRIVMADRKQQGYPLPRAVTHDSEFARIMQGVGLSPEETSEFTQEYDNMYVWRNANKELLVEVDWSGVGTQGWFNTYFFHQPSLEEEMLVILRGMPNVTLLSGWDATVVENGLDAVTVSLSEIDGGSQKAVTSKYTLGIDGANSGVRASQEIDWVDLGFYYDWLVVDVLLEPETDFPHVASQSCDPARPTTMVPGGPGRRRWEFMRLPDETSEELNTPEKAWELLSMYGVDPSKAKLERHSVYRFQAGWAKPWRKGRVILAGDSAHLMPPFAGQGLCAGLRDAMNICWKLDLVLAGKADDAFLDTYETERQPHIQEFIEFSVALGRVICITDPSEAAERDKRMIAQLHGGDGYLDAPPAPQLGPGAHFADAGKLSPQGRVEIDGESKRFDDPIRGTSLVVRNANQIAPEVKTLARELRITIVAIAGSSSDVVSAADIDGVYTSWLDSLDADAILIRPDFYTFGKAKAVEIYSLLTSFSYSLHPGIA